ncbi:MAG: hypothetical protein ACOYN0_07105 [Phycisphaerales bacterium]
MLSLSVVVLAATLAGPHTPGFSHGGQRSLATPRAYSAGIADSVRRHGFNGRLFVTLSSPGPVTHHFPTGSNAEAYGAAGLDDARVLARVGTEVVGFTPWQAFDGDGMKRYESARQEWLKEHGFVGGVRTFVNDAFLATHLPAHASAQGSDQPAVAAKKGKIEPRAIIELSPDLPRFRKRMEVRVIREGEHLARSESASIKVVDGSVRVASK